MGSGDILTERKWQRKQRDAYFAKVSAYKGRGPKRVLVLPALLLSVGIISLVVAILDREFSGLLFGIVIIEIALAVAYVRFLPRRIVLKDRRIEFWIRRKKWFEADWEEVTRVICYWAYNRIPGLIIKTEDDSFFVSTDLGFKESDLKEIFRVAVDLPRGYYKIKIRDELGWGDAKK